MSTITTQQSDPLATILAERHSCRAFLTDPVAREQIEALLQLARRSPSWCNTQPWRLIVTTGAATDNLRAGLIDWAQTHPPAPDLDFPAKYEGAAQTRRRECAWQLYEAVGITPGDRDGSARQTARNFELFGAPHLAIITTQSTLGIYGAVDCGVYIAHFLLAAQSLGIAAIPQAAIASCAPYLRQRYALPDDQQIVCGISFGYEDDQHPANAFRTSRADPSDTVTWTT